MSRIHKPQNISQALDLLASEPMIPFAGGTDYMVQNRRGSGLAVYPDKTVLLIGHLPELNFVTKTEDGIQIGAATPLSFLLRHPDIPTILKQAIHEIASVGIRNMATIGGNICNASPAADSLPPLYNLNAGIVLRSVAGRRTLSLEKFITGPGSTELRADEILESISFSALDYSVGIFRKLGTRKANALSKVAFCGIASTDKNTLKMLRMSVGAVAPVVIRLYEVETMLTGCTRKDVDLKIEAVLKTTNSVINPIDDQRSTAAYRRGVTLNLVRQFVLEERWGED